jgi:general transcription factor 3C polypeptide 3 (transcription factor C subunit 4)
LGASGDPKESSQSKAEAYYNIGRLYQLLGINYLALEYYSKAKKVFQSCGVWTEALGGLDVMVTSNEYALLVINQNSRKALTLLKGRVQL